MHYSKPAFLPTPFASALQKAWLVSPAVLVNAPAVDSRASPDEQGKVYKLLMRAEHPPRGTQLQAAAPQKGSALCPAGTRQQALPCLPASGAREASAHSPPQAPWEDLRGLHRCLSEHRGRHQSSISHSSSWTVSAAATSDGQALPVCFFLRPFNRPSLSTHGAAATTVDATRAAGASSPRAWGCPRVGESGKRVTRQAPGTLPGSAGCSEAEQNQRRRRRSLWEQLLQKAAARPSPPSEGHWPCKSGQENQIFSLICQKLSGGISCFALGGFKQWSDITRI